jgi:DNA mismatch endonuclease (patch repair protein)
MDTKQSTTKSLLMSRIRTKGTAPELALRSALHASGCRFRLHGKDLPGKPDIILPKYKSVIFVHGCFWHHHEGCIKSKMPKTNSEFWKNKISENVRRDNKNKKKLEALGWRVFITWECEIKKDAANVASIIIEQL